MSRTQNEKEVHESGFKHSRNEHSNGLRSWQKYQISFKGEKSCCADRIQGNSRFSEECLMTARSQQSQEVENLTEDPEI